MACNSAIQITLSTHVFVIYRRYINIHMVKIKRERYKIKNISTSQPTESQCLHKINFLDYI